MNLFRTLYFKYSLLLTMVLAIALPSCGEEEAPSDQLPKTDYGYTIAIHSPAENSAFSLGDTLPISIDYTSTTGEIVHYIRVEIFSKKEEVRSLYSVYSHQHVPQQYQYRDALVIQDSSKIEDHTEWIIEASMWSHDIEADTIRRQNNFYINQ